MKFTLSWLKEYIETSATVDEICATLTSIGLEVEGVEDKGKLLSQFEIAKILEAEKHPNADRLKYCKVQTSTGILNVVCGAPNARAGLMVVLARPGHTVPATGVVLKKSEIRGVPSEGMMCSEAELGLPETINDGIMELPVDAVLGANFAEYMGYNDPVIEIAVTPNRGDALGIYGIARDLAAAGIGTLKSIATKDIASTFTSPISVTITDSNCPMFVGRYFKNVKNCESPAWLKRRLEAVGLRPISALVDITNYITVGFGRPLHVFDADKVTGNITVRPSREGEIIHALNDKKYTLPDGFTVVADDKAAEAIGGIIGGMETGCQMETTNVFLEVAYFSPLKIAREGRFLELNTDARYRFERGVDPAFLQTGAELASAMIVEICGGQASEFVVAGSQPEWKRSYNFRHSYVKKLGGVDVAENKCLEILRSLGFSLEKNADAYTAHVPSWRSDISGEADLVEEILRINGYDNIPEIVPVDSNLQPEFEASPSFKAGYTARRILASRGMLEACTFSFMDSRKMTPFAGLNAALKLQNPISEELDALRPSLVPNLLDAAARNIANSSAKSAALFEVGKQFDGIDIKQQRLVAGGVRYGEFCGRSTHAKVRSADVFDAKADALAVLEALGAPVAKLDVSTQSPKWYHPGKSGSIKLGKFTLAVFGELHPIVLKQYDIKNAVAFEVYIGELPETKTKFTRPALKISELPLVERDFAFVLDDEVQASELVKTILAADKEFIKSANVFDVFKGGEIPSGKKSVAVQIIIEPKDKTLTDNEITIISDKITKSVTALGGAMRVAKAA